ncbi:MAG: hypothetical protein FWD76_03310 [Firmicutes bacterium]|nr:hypothetical protein [Bacillota bacterium]
MSNLITLGSDRKLFVAKKFYAMSVGEQQSSCPLINSTGSGTNRGLFDEFTVGVLDLSTVQRFIAKVDFTIHTVMNTTTSGASAMHSWLRLATTIIDYDTLAQWLLRHGYTNDTAGTSDGKFYVTREAISGRQLGLVSIDGVSILVFDDGNASNAYADLADIPVGTAVTVTNIWSLSIQHPNYGKLSWTMSVDDYFDKIILEPAQGTSNATGDITPPLPNDAIIVAESDFHRSPTNNMSGGNIALDTSEIASGVYLVWFGYVVDGLGYYAVSTTINDGDLQVKII